MLELEDRYFFVAFGTGDHVNVIGFRSGVVQEYGDNQAVLPITLGTLVGVGRYGRTVSSSHTASSTPERKRAKAAALPCTAVPLQ